jgi:hypothetical protein
LEAGEMKWFRETTKWDSELDKTNATLNEYRVQFGLHTALARLDPPVEY